MGDRTGMGCAMQAHNDGVDWESLGCLQDFLPRRSELDYEFGFDCQLDVLRVLLQIDWSVTYVTRVGSSSTGRLARVAVSGCWEPDRIPAPLPAPS